MTKITPTGFVPVEIPIISSALERGRDALEFFQLNQKERVSIEVEDDHLVVDLDECSLSWFLDTTDPEVRVRWWSGQADAYVVTGVPRYIEVVEPGMPVDEEDGLCDAVHEMMGDLAAYGYAASGGGPEHAASSTRVPRCSPRGPTGSCTARSATASEFEENGSHPCDWKLPQPGDGHEDPRASTASFEWYDGTDLRVRSVRGCGLERRHPSQRAGKPWSTTLMTDQKETNMTILDPDEVERLAQLREHIQQGVVPGQASGVFLMSVIDRQEKVIADALACLIEPGSGAMWSQLEADELAPIVAILRGEDL
jgi:hypothetical protein